MLHLDQFQYFEVKSFKDSWKLSNLQPLEKSANASKGAKICPKV